MNDEIETGTQMLPTMNFHSASSLDPWIRDCFARLESREELFPSYRRLFLRGLGDDLPSFEADPNGTRHRVSEPDDPESETMGELAEFSAGFAFRYFETAVDEGHGEEYAESYAHLAFGDPGPSGAPRAAYEEIGKGAPYSPQHPGYLDTFKTALHRTGCEKIAKRCADTLPDHEFTFSEALEAAREYEKGYAASISKGNSEFRAARYAQALGRMSPDFAALFAECIEDQVKGGRTEEDAERIAKIYTDLFDEHGSFDPSYDLHEIANDHCMAMAEARFRFRTEYGDKQRFFSAFDSVWQRDIGCQDFDGTEEKALKLLAAQDAYMAEHGNLRGFVDEDAPVCPPMPNFEVMSDSELASFVPDQWTLEPWIRESKFRDWCKEECLYPKDQASRDAYRKKDHAPCDDEWDDHDDDD